MSRQMGQSVCIFQIQLIVLLRLAFWLDWDDVVDFCCILDLDME